MYIGKSDAIAGVIFARSFFIKWKFFFVWHPLPCWTAHGNRKWKFLSERFFSKHHSITCSINTGFKIKIIHGMVNINTYKNIQACVSLSFTLCYVFFLIPVKNKIYTVWKLYKYVRWVITVSKLRWATVAHKPTILHFISLRVIVFKE